MADRDPAIQYFLKNENGLSNNPNDPGGITRYGISLRFLKSLEDPRKYGLESDITQDTILSLSKDTAINILAGEFWNNAPFHKLEDQDLCNQVFDAAVNTGISPAIKCLQRAIWASWRIKPILVDDGILGPETLRWLSYCNPVVLLPAFRSERAGFYRIVSEKNPSLEDNLPGWLNRAYSK